MVKNKVGGIGISGKIKRDLISKGEIESMIDEKKEEEEEEGKEEENRT